MTRVRFAILVLLLGMAQADAQSFEPPGTSEVRELIRDRLDDAGMQLPTVNSLVRSIPRTAGGSSAGGVSSHKNRLQYVPNADEIPIETAVSAYPDPAPPAQEIGSGAPPISTCGGVGCTPSGGLVRPRTVHVNGYTRRDGTYVAPYVRAAPRRR
jgi:hypothetical protein